MTTIILDSDTFTRGNLSASGTISTGWGTASSGSSWSVSTGSGSFSIASNEGHVTSVTSSTNMVLGSTSKANVEGLVRIKCSASTATRMGISLRCNGTNTFYMGRLSANANNFSISKVVSGTTTDLFTTAFTVTTATYYWIKFRAIGTTLEAKAWADGSGEPGSWTVSGTDSSISAAGTFGVTVNASSGANTWDMDTLSFNDGTNNQTAQVRLRLQVQNTKTAQTRTRLQIKKTLTAQLRLLLSAGTLATKTAQLRLKLAPTSTKTAQARLRLQVLRTLTAQTRTRLAPLVTKTAQTRTRLRVTNTKTAQTRTRLQVQATKTAQTRARLRIQNTKTAQMRLRLPSISTRTAQVRARLNSTATKTAQLRTRLRITKTQTAQIRLLLTTPSIASGKMVLFANGTVGTVSYDHFRVTQYPDPSLSLANVTPRLGTSSVSWDATIPTNTTLAVKTSLDGVNFTDVTSGNGGSIPGLTSQIDPIIDLFDVNSSANYTSTNITGGATATPTFDTSNSRLILVGGAGGLYLYTSVTDNDVDMQTVMDYSDNGGLVWRYVDQSNYYELACYDDSASGGFTNQLRLNKVVAGTRSLIGTASTVSWPRSTPGTSPYKLIRVTMLGTTINVYFDGVLMQTATDSTFTTGKMGLRNNGGTSRYYFWRFIQVGDYVSGTPIGDIVTGDFVYTQVAMTTTDPAATPQMQDLTTTAYGPQLARGALIPQLHSDTIPFKYFFNDEMKTLATASGDYWWDINAGSLTFNHRTAQLAPFCLHSADLLYAPLVQPTYSADLYRNRQNITNCLDTVTITNEQKIADGTASSWSLAYQVYSAPTITVQDVTKTVGVLGIDTGKDFYWQAGSVSISQDTSATVVQAGFIILASYVGQFTRTVTVDNLAEPAARALVESSTGIVEAVEDGKGMLASLATVYATGLLAKHGNNSTVEIVVVTERAGLAQGMYLPVFIPEHRLLDALLLIVKVTSNPRQQLDGSVLYDYTIDATNGSNLNNWADALFS